jgi:hypothetical protein
MQRNHPADGLRKIKRFLSGTLPLLAGLASAIQAAPNGGAELWYDKPAGSKKPETMHVHLTIDHDDPRLSYGAARLRDALEDAGVAVNEQAKTEIRIEVSHDQLLTDSESFRILRKGDNLLVVRGGGPVGALYGALTVAEDLRNGVALKDIQQRLEKPRFPFRAIKFNLPWMSYRKGPSLQLHQETCRDLKFWKALFRMAKDRGIETYLVNWNIFVSPEFARAHNVAKYSINWRNYIGEADTSEPTGIRLLRTIGLRG